MTSYSRKLLGEVALLLITAFVVVILIRIGASHV